MSLVLGLSVTSKDIHGELVDGDTGQGEHLNRQILDVDHIQDYLAELPADADLRAVGLTWSHDAETEAIKVREALDTYAGGAPVVAVRDVEAAAALARGIAEITGSDFLVVCVVEPDGAVVATVDGFRLAVESIDHEDAATLNDRVRAVVRSARPSPDAVYILGSEDTDDLVAAVREETDRPVLTATEADFALTRGAALASAGAANTPDTPVAQRHITRVGALAATLVAAVVVFVVSVSLALASGPPPPAQDTTSPRPVAVERPIAPKQAVGEALRPQAPIVQAKTINLPPAAAPADPAPAAAPPPPSPRLRDRIFDRLPLVDRIR